MAERTQIETYTGRYFDFEDPRPEQITLEDIARALSFTCRFGGHTSRVYSVAQHALLVYGLVAEQTTDPTVRLAALHHDSHEAYVGDIPTPFKRALGTKWKGIVTAIDQAIMDALRLEQLGGPLIHDVDKQALRIEAASLKLSQGVNLAWETQFIGGPPAAPDWWLANLTPTEAEKQFIHTHHHERNPCGSLV